MWMIIMFDLPVISKKERKDANKFRLFLLDLGFLKCQLSVYAKFCTSREQVGALIGCVRKYLPPKGSVDILTITDSQFKRIVCFQERKNINNYAQPKQLELF